MIGNRGKDTRPEQRVRSLLHAKGLRFRKHVRPVPHLRCQADVVFPREQVAVFVDGCFWHGCPQHGRVPQSNSGYWAEKLERNLERDARNSTTLAEAGWLVLRFWEHDPIEEVAEKVHLHVTTRRGDWDAR